MLIALLALLGVNLIVIVVLLAGVLARKRWVRSQPGGFKGVARGVSGDARGFRPKWRRGYGRWVRGVLVWTKGPFFFWNELLPVNGVAGERPARDGEARRLGDAAVVVTLTSDDGSVEVIARGEARGLLLGPYDGTADAAPAPSSATPG